MSLLDEADGLYRTAVLEPDRWSDQTTADWAESLSMSGELDKATAKHLRRIVRVAEKLQRFWADDSRKADVTIDWKSRVDIALGVRAWRPVLDLGSHLLDEQPDQETFEAVAELFRVVNNAEWMEGMSYNEWRSGYQRN